MPVWSFNFYCILVYLYCLYIFVMLRDMSVVYGPLAQISIYSHSISSPFSQFTGGPAGPVSAQNVTVRFRANRPL